MSGCGCDGGLGGLGKARRKHKGRKRAKAKHCKFGVNKRTGKCLKHPRKRSRRK